MVPTIVIIVVYNQTCHYVIKLDLVVVLWTSDPGLVGQELVCIILKCNVSVVLSQMFSDGPDLRDADLGASQVWYQSCSYILRI